MTGYIQCPGCKLWYVDSDCGQADEHRDCPHPCSIDGKPMTYDEAVSDRCQGHTRAEADAFLAGLRSRPTSGNGHQGE